MLNQWTMLNHLQIITVPTGALTHEDSSNLRDLRRVDIRQFVAVVTQKWSLALFSVYNVCRKREYVCLCDIVCRNSDTLRSFKELYMIPKNNLLSNDKTRTAKKTKSLSGRYIHIQAHIEGTVVWFPKSWDKIQPCFSRESRTKWLRSESLTEICRFRPDCYTETSRCLATIVGHSGR
jgi:hypothetical protein